MKAKILFWVLLSYLLILWNMSSDISGGNVASDTNGGNVASDTNGGNVA